MAKSRDTIVASELGIPQGVCFRPCSSASRDLADIAARGIFEISSMKVMGSAKTSDRALAFVQKHHAGQMRAGGMPAWHHLLRVSNLLNQIFEKTKEGAAGERFLIPIAALGHDLLEDTKATEKEIAVIFGDGGLALIKGMTNRLGDKNHGPYIKHMTHAEEAVRLIKLSDLCDNYTSVTYNLALLGIPWTRSFFLPIVKPMHARVRKTKFSKYKRSATILIALVDAAERMLDEELKRQTDFKKNKKQPRK